MTKASQDRSDFSTRLVKFGGECDLRRKDEIAGLFSSLGGEGSVVIDMTAVTYIDSFFLGELSMLRLRDGARSITLAGANENVRRILKTVSFDEIFDITE